MLYEKMTAAQAVQHFSKNKYLGILPVLKERGKSEYDRVRKIIHDAKKNRVSDRRAKALLEKYGGEAYRVNTSFEVAITEGNGKAFAELAADFREKHPNAFGLDECEGDLNETKTEQP